MATPTTLADLAAQTDALFKAVLATARGELASAQAGVNAARATQKADAATLAGMQKAIAALEASLPTAKTPADAATILAEIATAEVEARAQGAALLDDGDRLAAAQAKTDAVAAWVGALQTRSTAAAASVAPAAAEKKRRDTWKTQATSPALAAVPTSADTLLGAAGKAAQKRVSDELPKELTAAVSAAWAAETARLTRAVGELDHAWATWAAEESTSGGTEGKAAALARTLAEADEALRRWAEQGVQRLARAQAQVAAVNAGTSLLTTAEAAALAADKDGLKAAKLRAPRETARAAVLPKAEGVADAELDARARAPETLDVSADTGVTTAAGVLAPLQKTLDDAAKDYLGSETAWGLWSGNVPDEVWARIAGLNEAVETLTELKGVKPQDLVDDDTDAEKDLAAELWAQVRHEVTAGFLQAQVALRGAVLEQALASRPARLVAGLRGDA